MIEYTCPTCGSNLKIPDEFAGKRGQCRRCKSTIDVPGKTTAALEQFDPFAPIDIGSLNVDVDKKPPPPVYVESEPKPTASDSDIVRTLGKLVVGGVVGLTAYVIVVLVFSGSDRYEAYQDAVDELYAPPPATLQQFNRIQTGMTYDQVVSILGTHGEVISESSVAGFHSIMYGWGGGLAAITCTFQDGQLMQKSQLGLE